MGLDHKTSTPLALQSYYSIDQKVAVHRNSAIEENSATDHTQGLMIAHTRTATRPCFSNRVCLRQSWLTALGCSLIFVLLFGGGCARSTSPTPEVSEAESRYESYTKSIQPLFDRRCAVCHSCNDAPCQLDSTSFTGVDRGASAGDVYADRLLSDHPTRLYIDAKTSEAWRHLGFFPVLANHPPGDARNLQESILFQLVQYRKANQLPEMHFDAFNSRNCPDLNSPIPRMRNELSQALRLPGQAYLGMPYGFPALTDQEFATLRTWLMHGAPGPERSPVSAVEQKQIEDWENYFNHSQLERRLVARYLYEHLFYAHLYFQRTPTTKPSFYRLVRSKTSAPKPIDEIATRLPYDDVGEFYYRLLPIESTIVHKTHLPYELSPARKARFESLFFSSPWTVNELPKYGSEFSGNPFVTFAAIPAKARYQFLLDDAEYIVANFMKGPVCRGQLALNVINDHFYIFFLDPKSDLSVTNTEFLRQTRSSLITPFRPGDLLTLEKGSDLWNILELPARAVRQLRHTFYPYFKSRQLRYLKRREQFYAGRAGMRLSDVWDGDGKNDNALLTVFRHFDSASVRKGAWGGMPKTALLLDYPIFERMYYNLVASFDIYGDVKLQLATRLYMDDLRIEAEDLYLSLLPKSERRIVRDSWYRGAEDTMNGKNYPIYGLDRESEVPVKDPANAHAEVLAAVVAALPINRLDEFNSFIPSSYSRIESPISSMQDFERALSGLGGRRGSHVRVMPDLSFLRVRAEQQHVFTLVRNRAHLNVKYIFAEDSRMAPEDDTLSILRGFHGSYPNYFFDIHLSEAKEFLADLQALEGDAERYSRFAKRYGVDRRDERFWEVSDWMLDEFARQEPVSAGLFDLNRYFN